MTTRYRGRPSLGTIVGFSFASLVFTAAGGFFFWYQHSGVPTRMTVVSCTTGQLQTCDGVLVGTGSDSTSGRIFISGATRKDLGRDIDVHYHTGGASVTDSNPLPLLLLAAGGVSGVCAVFFVVGRRTYPRAKVEALRQAKAAGTVVVTQTDVDPRRASGGGSE